jgi:hypothetical protein
MKDHNLRHLSEQIDLCIVRLERDVKPQLRQAFAEDARGSFSDRDLAFLRHEATALLQKIYRLLSAKVAALQGSLADDLSALDEISLYKPS